MGQRPSRRLEHSKVGPRRMPGALQRSKYSSISAGGNTPQAARLAGGYLCLGPSFTIHIHPATKTPAAHTWRIRLQVCHAKVHEASHVFSLSGTRRDQWTMLKVPTKQSAPWKMWKPNQLGCTSSKDRPTRIHTMIPDWRAGLGRRSVQSHSVGLAEPGNISSGFEPDRGNIILG